MFYSVVCQHTTYCTAVASGTHFSTCEWLLHNAGMIGMFGFISLHTDMHVYLLTQTHVYTCTHTHTYTHTHTHNGSHNSSVVAHVLIIMFMYLSKWLIIVTHGIKSGIVSV